MWGFVNQIQHFDWIFWEAPNFRYIMTWFFFATCDGGCFQGSIARIERVAESGDCLGLGLFDDFVQKHPHGLWKPLTLPETNSSHLKMTPWRRRFLLETIIFRCYVIFGECILYLSVKFSHLREPFWWRFLGHLRAPPKTDRRRRQQRQRVNPPEQNIP